jgi:hypothetical protein
MSHRLSSVAELTLAVPRSVCGVIPEARDWYGNAPDERECQFD